MTSPLSDCSRSNSSAWKGLTISSDEDEEDDCHGPSIPSPLVKVVPQILQSWKGDVVRIELVFREHERMKEFVQAYGRKLSECANVIQLLPTKLDCSGGCLQISCQDENSESMYTLLFNYFGEKFMPYLKTIWPIGT